MDNQVERRCYRRASVNGSEMDFRLGKSRDNLAQKPVAFDCYRAIVISLGVACVWIDFCWCRRGFSTY